MRRLASGLLPFVFLASAMAFPAVLSPAPPASPDRGEEEEAKQDRPDEFQRYHAEVRTAEGQDRPAYAPGYAVEAFEAAQALAKTGAWLPWEEHGPGNVAGRTRALVRDVRDATNRSWWLGTAGGGIWRTTTGGAAWTNVSGSLPNLAVSALAQAPSDPRVLYAGTGEGFGNADAIAGAGVFVSTDGGTTWSARPASYAAGMRSVNRLAVSPYDARVVLAATTTGLFRSADGGASWTRTNVTGSTKDLRATPDFSVLVATVDGSCTAPATPPRLYRSTDGGVTWASVAYPGLTGMRSELAVAPSRPQRMYATVDACSGASGLHVSDDAGATWTAAANATSSDWMGAQGWYDNSIAVHPFNPDLIFVGGVDLWTGVVTGVAPSVAYTKRTRWNAPETAADYVHADNHAIVPFVTNAATQAFTLWTATDGGVFQSVNGGVGWSALNAGLNTTQFYGADRQPGAIDRFVAGAQDNGTWLSPAGPGRASAWTERQGGDGFDAVFNDAGEYVGSLYYNQLYRHTVGATAYASATSGLADVGSGKGPFITHLGHSRADPNRLLIGGISGVWRSDDFGRSWAASRMRNVGVADAKWGYSSLRSLVHVSAANPQVVWAGQWMGPSGNVWVSTDGGASFRPTPNSPLVSARLSGLASHPRDKRTAFALFSVAGTHKILKTTDLGQTWAPLSGTFTTGAPLSSNGFPDVAVYSLLAMPYDPNVLWAGTEIGLFESTDGGASWQYAASGLPPVAVWQMKVVEGAVVVATHGRGLWSVRPALLGGYGHPGGVTPPLLASVAFDAAGRVRLAGTNRAAYDSLVAVVDDVPVARRTGVGAGEGFAFVLDVPTSPARTLDVQVFGYLGGDSYASLIKQVQVYPVREPVLTYLNDFNGPNAAADFLAAGFSVRTVSGFATPVAATSPTPYEHNQDYTFQLTTPVRVATSGAVLTFNEVLLAEPCTDGTATCTNGGFYDYAVVEATRDGGATWVPLAGPYDSRASASWLAAYTAGTTSAAPTPALVRPRTVSLVPAFAPGEVVQLRFRLHTDVSAASWGWLLDDLQVQPSGVPTDDPGAPVFATGLGAPFPNPARGAASVEVTMASAGAAEVYVVDVLGRRLQTLHRGVLAAGAHRLPVDASGLPAGLYFVRLDAGNVQRTRGLTVAR